MNIRTVSLVLAVAALSTVGFADPKTNVGKPLPTFTLKDVSGKKWTNASLKGKPVILDFWATWCGPCKAASATMESLSKKYASKGLVVLAANASDSVAKVKEYSEGHKYSFPFLVDAHVISDRLGIVNLPCIFIIGKSGKVTSVTTEWTAASPAKFEKLLQAAFN